MESATTSDADCQISALPDELLAIVFSFVPCVERRRTLSLVSSRWRAVALDAASGTLCVHKHRHFAKATAYDAARGAIRTGHLLCLRWIYERRYVHPDRYLYQAAWSSPASSSACIRYIGQKRQEYHRPPTEDEVALYAWKTDTPSVWSRMRLLIGNIGHAIRRALDPAAISRWLQIDGLI
nr:ankyrin repeat protein [Pandoravirus massiliensis]